ncbi:helix-turn-helix transcriptional regulator [Kitasatospora sp. NPDC059803]|uniref:helix-turn-helix transcriptional regulator n=1 Tax=Kitasatospora sp. NPDC059803 TaxID=3346953 RepID=UPI00365A3DA2
MGRPERPVTTRTKESAALALYLRVLRQSSGHTYAELGKITGIHPTRLSRAASGDSVPTLDVVEAYAAGCGAMRKELTEARRLWRAARRAGAKSPAERPAHITMINTPWDLWQAMVHLHLKVGRPSLRELERRAGGLGRLPRSTLSLVLRGGARPSRELLEDFVQACEVPSSEIKHWLEAWDRIRTPRPTSVLWAPASWTSHVRPVADMDVHIEDRVGRAGDERRLVVSIPHQARTVDEFKLATVRLARQLLELEPRVPAEGGQAVRRSRLPSGGLAADYRTE